MDNTAEPIRGNPDLPLIPDLRGVPLGQLAGRAGDPADLVGRVVHRFMDSMESPSRVPVTMFNSAL